MNGSGPDRSSPATVAAILDRAEAALLPKCTFGEGVTDESLFAVVGLVRDARAAAARCAEFSRKNSDFAREKNEGLGSFPPWEKKVVSLDGRDVPAFSLCVKSRKDSVWFVATVFLVPEHAIWSVAVSANGSIFHLSERDERGEAFEDAKAAIWRSWNARDPEVR